MKPTSSLQLRPVYACSPSASLQAYYCGILPLKVPPLEATDRNTILHTSSGPLPLSTSAFSSIMNFLQKETFFNHLNQRVFLKNKFSSKTDILRSSFLLLLCEQSVFLSCELIGLQIHWRGIVAAVTWWGLFCVQKINCS